MNKRFNSMQSGFTLIELIVVIVILGILAATALPKFVGISGDARAASLQAAKGALTSSSAMLHGKYLITPVTPLVIEGGAEVAMTSNGYPVANAAFATAAGVAADYDIDTSVVGTLTVTPKNLPTDLKSDCSVSYTTAANANAAPVIALPTTVKCE